MAGPGRRVRSLVREKGKMERELRRFEVLEGGKAQGSQNGDDMVH